jgi:hypothetical protein
MTRRRNVVVEDPRDRINTPIEVPTATLPEHREMIRSLVDAGVQLSAALNTLGDVVHELRVARDPMGNSTRQTIGRFGRAIRDAGAGIVDTFAPDLAAAATP